MLRRTTSPTNEVDGIRQLDTSATTSRNASTWVDEQRTLDATRISSKPTDFLEDSCTLWRTSPPIPIGVNFLFVDSGTRTSSVTSELELSFRLREVLLHLSSPVVRPPLAFSSTSFPFSSTTADFSMFFARSFRRSRFPAFHYGRSYRQNLRSKCVRFDEEDGRREGIDEPRILDRRTFEAPLQSSLRRRRVEYGDAGRSADSRSGCVGSRSADESSGASCDSVEGTQLPRQRTSTSPSFIDFLLFSSRIGF